MICSSLVFFSCLEKTQYHWEAGISAPKYYPVAGNVNFGYAAFGSNTAFDNGWGDTYASIVSGDKYKKIPKKVFIEYYSVVDSKDFQGDVDLPQEKLKELFQKYDNDKSFLVKLVVGMAPGGWIRVWFQTLDRKKDEYVSIEVAKAQLKGFKNQIVGIGLKTKDFKTWGNTHTYWQHHGIPYEAWAENEKEYDLFFDFQKPNLKNEVTDPQYSSLDGTFYFRTSMNKILHRKLPADIVVVWKSKKANISYDTHVSFPRNFSKIIEERKSKKVIITLKIEQDDQHGVIYITTNNKKEKLLRFKAFVSKDKIMGNSDFAKDIEYFIP